MSKTPKITEKFEAIVLNPLEHVTLSYEGKKPKIPVKDLIYVYESHPIVYAVVNKVVKNVARNGYTFERDGEVLKDDPIIQEIEDVFHSTQNDTNLQMLIRQIVQDLAIVGDTYLEYVRMNARVQKLDHISPKYMRKKVNTVGIIQGYGQYVNGKFITNFAPDEVFNESLGNADVYGKSPVEAAFQEIVTDIGAILFNKKFFENDATPMTFWKLTERLKELPKEQQEQVKNQLMESYQGANKSGKPVMSNVVDDVKVIERDLNKFQFSETRDKFIEKLCAAFDMSKSVIGLTDSANESTASQTMKQQFYETAVRPYENMIERFLNEEVLPALGYDVQIRIVKQEFADMAEKVQRVIEMRKAGIITENEARTQLGLPVIEEPWAYEYQVMTTMGYVPVLSNNMNDEQKSIIAKIREYMR